MRLLLLGALMAALQAQAPSPNQDLWAKLNPFFGGELAFIDIRFLNTPLFSSTTNYWGLTVGSNYTYFRTEDDFLAVGPGAQVTGAFQFLGGLGTNWMIAVPVYAHAHIGAGATAYNVQRLGLGVGAGLRFVSFQLTYTTFSSNYVGKLRQTYLNPTAFVDLTFNLRRVSPTTLRLYFDVLPSRRNTDILGSIDPVPLDFRTIGGALVYSLPR
ncbi:MAG: hypothetical protein KatS3mg026_1061 [Bacteroidia bacterium]|nr:MAG: hypothetical protein KatS3mg026_1061 [Bacteroidia bacterium]